ncbi:CsiV family protein [Arenicella xantha]|nr:CsiV family protein [Arenicella xantha]
MNVIQHNYKTIRLGIFTTVSLLFLSFTTVASAKDYMVEVLIFKHSNPSTASESHDYTPPQPMRSASTTWKLDPSMLVDDAEKLEKSSNYHVMHHLSWGQESLSYRESATFTVFETDTQGYIKVYADDLLFINVDLDVTGFRMQEKRRLKLNEKHFFDHPKFGLLVQVSRLEAEPEAESVIPSEVESKTAQPTTNASGELNSSR